MDKLTKIKQQAEELITLLTEAIGSESRQTQEQALYSYEYFQVINKKNCLNSLMMEHRDAATKIKLVQQTIPNLMAIIENKAKTLREILGVSEAH